MLLSKFLDGFPIYKVLKILLKFSKIVRQYTTFATQDISKNLLKFSKIVKQYT